jgi:RNA polymerase sigma-B factor
MTQTADHSGGPDPGRPEVGGDAAADTLDAGPPGRPDRPDRPDRPNRDEVLARFRAFRATGRRDLRNALIEEHRWIGLHCARRFAKRGEPIDDLTQVAQLGVLKAVERFDPEMGVSFTTFAMPTVLGELRRHFRDATWAVRVPRRAKDLHLELGAVVEQLSQRHGRAPTIDEIAETMQVSREDVLQAMEAGTAYRAAPLTPPGDGDGDEDVMEDGITIGSGDPELGRSDDRMAARALLARLPPRERRIVFLRFFEEMTQSEIADLVGVSQVHVSRLLRSSLARLRDEADTVLLPSSQSS